MIIKKIKSHCQNRKVTPGEDRLTKQLWLLWNCLFCRCGSIFVPRTLSQVFKWLLAVVPWSLCAWLSLISEWCSDYCSVDLLKCVKLKTQLYSRLLTAPQSRIVKPWSKSESKPLSKQAPKLNKSLPKKKKEGFGPWADTKITWATHPTHNF